MGRAGGGRGGGRTGGWMDRWAGLPCGPSPSGPRLAGWPDVQWCTGRVGWWVGGWRSPRNGARWRLRKGRTPLGTSSGALVPHGTPASAPLPSFHPLSPSPPLPFPPPAPPALHPPSRPPPSLPRGAHRWSPLSSSEPPTTLPPLHPPSRPPRAPLPTPLRPPWVEVTKERPSCPPSTPLRPPWVEVTKERPHTAPFNPYGYTTIDHSIDICTILIIRDNNIVIYRDNCRDKS
jgi:hypothetical protein